MTVFSVDKPQWCSREKKRNGGEGEEGGGPDKDGNIQPRGSHEVLDLLFH